MAGYSTPPPPGVPPVPPPGFDPRAQRRYYRDQARAQRAAARAQRQQIRYQMRSMRRRSVLGPLLLICVGVLFLLVQSGHIAHDSFWAWYSHWWPVVLVAAGVVVLVEWALDQHAMSDPQHPPYRRSIGGGVTILLLLFVFSGVFAGNAIRFHGDQPGSPFNFFSSDNFDRIFGDKHESDQNLDLAFADGNSLNVVNPHGDVTISGTSDDGRVHIAIHKEVYAHSDADADAKAQELNPNTTTYGSTLRITMPALDGTRSDLVLNVPASAVIAVTANHGDIHATSLKAQVTATANHGDIELSAISGAATAHVNSPGSSLSAHNLDGGITVEGHGEDVMLSDVTGPVQISGEFFGSTHLEHINGTIRFHTSRTDLQLARLDGEAEISPHSDLSADQAMGPLVLTTSARNISLDRIAGDIAVTDSHGSIDLTVAPTAGGGVGTITLENRNGNIKAVMPSHAGFSIQAETTDGSIDTSDFFKTASTGGTKGSGAQITETDRSVNGTVGAGGPLVHISTTDGDISLLKADTAPLPPTAPPPPKITFTPPPGPPPPPPAHGPKH